jgi:hypothetical protein
MRIEVPQQQRHLKKQQAHGPDGSRAAEPRQNDLGDDRLNLKQQEGAHHDCQCVKNHVSIHGPRAVCRTSNSSGLNRESTQK